MFPDAEVFGCDINERILEIARRSTQLFAEVFYGSEDEIKRRAPFDFICAMSSLCIHPPPQNFAEVFPFERFERIVKMFATVLKDGGALALYNSAYLLRSTRTHVSFTPVRSDMIFSNGFVNLYDESSKVLLEYGVSPTGQNVRGIRDADRLDDYDLVDCVWAKTPYTGDPIVINFRRPDALATAGYKLAFGWERSELDGFDEAARARFIDTRRAYRCFVRRGPNATVQDVVYEFDVYRNRLHHPGTLVLATCGPLRPMSGVDDSASFGEQTLAGDPAAGINGGVLNDEQELLLRIAVKQAKSPHFRGAQGDFKQAVEILGCEAERQKEIIEAVSKERDELKRELRERTLWRFLKDRFGASHKH